jgi:hypothetical protein
MFLGKTCCASRGVELSPILVTYPTWEEIYGSRPTEDQLLSEVRSLDRLHTFWLLARINILLALDRYQRDPQLTIKLQTQLVNQFIGDDLFEDLRRRFGPERLVDRSPFHSLQILLLMKRVVLEGARTGGRRPDTEREAALCLGRCLIMVNDFLFSEGSARAIRADRVSTKRRRIALQLQVGPGLEVNNPPAIEKSIVRSDLIFLEIPSKLPSTLDVGSIFHGKTGLSLEEYVDHVFGVLTHYITLDPQKLMDETGLACVDTGKYFAEAPKDSVERFWRMELASLDELEEMLRKPSRLKEQHDFIAFRKKPFIQVAEGNAVPVHVGFIQEKRESGMFWSIFNSLTSDDERDALFREWGRLFEQYVSQALVQSFKGTPETYFPFPKFADNGEEAFDGLVTAGDHWVAMEYKGGFLKAEAKYAEDEDEFIRDTEKKFGRDKRAGMEQLARKIGAVLASPMKLIRPLLDIDHSGVKVVVPLLIVQEPFISSEVTTPYLVDIFGTLKRKQQLNPKVTCTIPLVMDISEIESLSPYLVSGKISFIDCIMKRVHLGGTRFLSFGDFLREYIDERRIERLKDTGTHERFRLIMNRISERFFKKPFTPGDKASGA